MDNMKFTRMLVIVGGLVTLAFGIWHFFAPSLYHWFDYIPSAPAELIKTIVATNFFLSVTLVLFGTLAIVIAIWQWQNNSPVKIMLWVMSILWLVRAVYQLILPQGTAIPGLSIGMTAIFSSTAFCFIFPLWLLMRER